LNFRPFESRMIIAPILKRRSSLRGTRSVIIGVSHVGEVGSHAQFSQFFSVRVKGDAARFFLLLLAETTNAGEGGSVSR